MNKKIERVKAHFQENKWVYISGSSVALLTGAVGFVIGQEGYQKIEVLNFKINSPDNSQTTVMLNRRGTQSNFVMDIDTKALYESQNLAAKAIGASASSVSQHLRGMTGHVNGHHLEVVGKSV